jgi:hypothetical protein
VIFARPEALWLLALALPVAALFLVRPKARRSAVGSVLLWRRVEKKRSARAGIARLEKLLSLLLHLAALAAIVFALARPLAREARPRRIVAVLDAGASMGARVAPGRTRFEAALESARRLVESLGPEDEVGFVLGGASPRVLRAPGGRDRKPGSALEGLVLEGGATDLRAALELGGALLDADAGARARVERELWLFSDGAAPELARPPKPRLPEGARLRYVRFGSPADGSVGVVSLAAREAPSSPGEVEVSAQVESSFRDRVRARATLFLDGDPVVSLEPFELEPGTRFSLPPRRVRVEGGGVLALRVEAPGDVLPLDDEAWLVIPGARRPLVQIEGEGASARFVRAVLENDDEVKVAPPPRGPGHDVSPDVLVLAGGSVPDEPPRAALVVGEEAAAAAGARRGWDLTVAAPRAPPRPTLKVPGHPLLRHVLLDAALFARTSELEPGASWTTVAGEPPLVLAREDAQGRRAVLLPFSPEETDLVLRRSWPLLIANAVSWLTGECHHEARPTVKTGSVARIAFARPLGDDVSVATVFRPSGERTTVPLEMVGSSEAQVVFTATSEPGVYTVVAGDRRSLPPRGAADARFAVSLLDAREGSIAARTALGLGEEPAGDLAPRAVELELPRILAAIAALALVLEGYLFHRRGLA